MKKLKLGIILLPILAALGGCFEGTEKSAQVFTGGKAICPLKDNVNYNILQSKNGKENLLGKISIRQNKDGDCTLFNASGLNFETSRMVGRFIYSDFRQINKSTFLATKPNPKTKNLSLVFVVALNDGKIGFITDCKNPKGQAISNKIGLNIDANACTLTEMSQYYKFADNIGMLAPDLLLVPTKN